MNSIQAEKNIKVYMYHKFFIGMMIIGPVLTPFLINKGLNYTQIMFLQSAAALSRIIFEIPTGVIADKISRKLSLILSGFFMAAGLIVYMIFDNFFILVLAEIIMGIGITFSSGADSAILYESIKGTQYEKDYSKYEATAFSRIFLGQGVGSVLSSMLFTLDKNIPFIISVFFLSVASVFAVKFIEPTFEKRNTSYILHVVQNTKNIFKSSICIWITVFAISFGCSNMIGYWMYEPLFKAVNIPILMYGIVFLALNLFASISAKVYSRYFAQKNGINSLLFLSFLMVLSFLIPGIFMNIIIIPVIFLQQIYRALYGPIIKNIINRNTENVFRATTISTISMFSSISYAIFLPVIGFILDNKGPQNAHVFVGMVFLAFLIVLFITGIKLKNAKARRIAKRDIA